MTHWDSLLLAVIQMKRVVFHLQKGQNPVLKTQDSLNKDTGFNSDQVETMDRDLTYQMWNENESEREGTRGTPRFPAGTTVQIRMNAFMGIIKEVLDLFQFNMLNLRDLWDITQGDMQ